MPTLIKLPNEYLITNIFAENNSSALLDDSGRILVCGDNTHNKLGVRNETKLLSFQILRILKDKIINVSMGLNHTILVTQNGKTIGMGKNSEGQLGIGNCTTYSYPQTANTPQNIAVSITTSVTNLMYNYQNDKRKCFNKFTKCWVV